MTVYLVMYSHQNLSATEEPSHTAVMRVFSTSQKAEEWIKKSTSICSPSPGENLWVDEWVVDAEESWVNIQPEV